MTRVRSRGWCLGIAAALAMGIASMAAPAVGPAVASTGGAPAGSSNAAGPPIDVTVGGPPIGQVIGPGFVGTSMEFQAVHAYTGRDPTNLNPVLVELLRRLAPGQQPVLRIGGDSTDQTWWPIKGVIPPGAVTYRLSPGWLRTTRALAQALNAKLILGVNLAAAQPALAAAEARAFVQGIGQRYIEALEIGNEPDVYGQFAWYKAPDGRVFFARRRSYSLADFEAEFERFRAALPNEPIAAPALAELNWATGLDGFLSANPEVSIVTVHRYPLRGCIRNPSSPIFATIPHLLTDASAAGIAQSVAPYVQIAHARGLPFRLGELNSVACSGIEGVSNTFASALWALDILFNLASVGVDGVNFHTLPLSGYELFTFTHKSAGWEAFVHPEYYGLLMFTQAAPPGSRLLPVTAPAGPVKVWATSAPGGVTHIVLINKSLINSQQVQLNVPGATAASVEWLRGPSASATAGVTLGERTFGAKTTTGALGSMRTGTLYPFLGAYSITVPAASAVMLTAR
jgi:hypothetical protein